MELSDERVEEFRETVFSFYEEHGRDLPWRRTTDRYRVYVSEVMLQQTQVTRVVPKYEAWMERWPTPGDLAEAPLQEVLSLWKGLGYNNRARWLRDAAKTVVEEYDGTVPASVEELQELKGVGPYTSRAICIFADNADIVTVDTNIRRIFIDAFGLDEEIDEDRLYEIAERVMPAGRSREWHNALMDYGALEKTSRETGIEPKTTQSTFEGSRRYYRGKIVGAVLEQPRELSWLKQEYDTGDVEGIVADLEEDGMVTEDDGTVRVDD